MFSSATKFPSRQSSSLSCFSPDKFNSPDPWMSKAGEFFRLAQEQGLTPRRVSQGESNLLPEHGLPKHMVPGQSRRWQQVTFYKRSFLSVGSLIPFHFFWWSIRNEIFAPFLRAEKNSACSTKRKGSAAKKKKQQTTLQIPTGWNVATPPWDAELYAARD